MVVNVRITVGLRRQTGGLAVVQALGDTVADVLADLARQFPDLGAKILSPEGGASDYINLFVNGENVRYLQGVDTPLPENAEITILPAAAGG
ncbi:MAG: MoaD/ThiS family protein [Chloroflexota bacterium]